MARRLFCTTLFVFISVAIIAQVKLTDVTQTYYNRLVWSGTNKTMTTKALLDAPVEKVPVGFLDTLKKYSWYELCNYQYRDQTLYCSFSGLDTTKADPLSRQFNYFNVSSTGVVFRNYVLKTTKNEFATYTNTFDTATATHVKSVSDVKGSTYLVQENYGETEYLKIISWKNGVLILETTRYGKPGEKPVMFRSAYMAMPKE